MLPTFQEQVEKDIDNVFFNVKMHEFATIHNVEGEDLSVIVDNTLLQERKNKDAIENISTGEVLFFCKKSGLGFLPRVGENMKFDKKTYQVSSVSDDMGVLEIVLSAYNSGYVG